MKRVCVFCGSRAGARSEFAKAARELAAMLVERKLGIVYGGGKVGLMGMLADAALERGGEVIGVIPRSLLDKEVGHRGVTQLLVVETMHERKARMNDLSDAFIALPGGFGTLDEFFEVLTWSQLGFHGKPCALLNVAGYYDRMLDMLDHAVTEGLLRPLHRELVIADTDPSRLLQRLGAFTPSVTATVGDAEENFP
ncbi:MAG: TIGR00730 family Rossman fold protein [Betaproteobacteria bacterium]